MRQSKRSRSSRQGALSILAALMMSAFLLGLSGQSVMAQTTILEDTFTHAMLDLGWPATEPVETGPAGLEWQGNGGPPISFDGAGNMSIRQGGALRDQFLTTVPGDGLSLPTDGNNLIFICIFNMPAGGLMSIGLHDADAAGWGPSPAGETSTRMFQLDGLTGDVYFTDDGDVAAGAGEDTGQDFTPGTSQGLMFCVEALSDTVGSDITLWYQDGAETSPLSPGWTQITPGGGPLTGFISSGLGDVEVGALHVGGASSPLLLDYVAVLHDAQKVPAELSEFVLD